jgi:hypothetical protein
MIVRLALVSLACLCLLEATATACPGQVGKVIFEDTFEDDSGGWQIGAPDSEVKNHVLLARPNARGLSEKYPVLDVFNLTFSASEGDFCTEFVLPKEPAPDNSVSAAIVFWKSDEKNYFMWLVSSAKRVILARYVDGRSSVIARVDENVPVKLDPGAVNTARVVVKDEKLTLFLNGTQMKVVRAAQPAGAAGFGLQVESIKPSEANPVIQFKSYKVTAGQ